MDRKRLPKISSLLRKRKTGISKPAGRSINAYDEWKPYAEERVYSERRYFRLAPVVLANSIRQAANGPTSNTDSVRNQLNIKRTFL